MNGTFSRRYGVIAVAVSWLVAFIWAIPVGADAHAAAIDPSTQACSVNWRPGGGYAYPAAYLVVGLAAPLAVQAAVYRGVYVGVVRTKRRLHQRAVVSGRGSIVNLAMRVSQSSSRWSVVSCQSRSSTSTTSSGPLSSVINILPLVTVSSQSPEPILASAHRLDSVSHGCSSPLRNSSGSDKLTVCSLTSLSQNYVL